MYSYVRTATLSGIGCDFVLAEADVSSGMPVFDMIGYLGSEVKEAKERVRTAMKNSGYLLPAKRITVNLSPANVKKSGSLFDLAVAISVMQCLGILNNSDMNNYCLVGELGIDGSLRPTKGVLPIAAACKEENINCIIVPQANYKEAHMVEGIKIVGVKNLCEAVNYLNAPKDYSAYENPRDLPLYIEETHTFSEDDSYDFSNVNGQLAIRRACEVAAAGMHNLLMVGPPGSGKSMIAKCMPSILPELTKEESMELSKIYSVSGMLNERTAFVKKRPFRSPHHTISPIGLIGGGIRPKPGEISLSHGGILFLDELPEFKKSTIELLRQPLEEKKVHIDRLSGSYEYPCSFQLVAAMNPCPCGFYPDRNKCSCTLPQLNSYMNKLSGPFLDRIDIVVDAPVISYDELKYTKNNEPSCEIRKRVEKAHLIQKERFKGEKYIFNSLMDGEGIRKYCVLSPDNEALMKKAYEKTDMSVRGYYKTLKTARTIADLSDSPNIERDHILEAISYRELSKNFGR